MSAAIGLVLAAFVVSAPLTSVRPSLHLDVHIEPGVSLPPPDLTVIASLVARVWKPVLDVVVSLPGAPRPAGVSDALRLVLTARVLEGQDTGLAWITFEDGEPRREVTVSLTAVGHLLNQGQWHGRSFSALPPAASRRFVQRAVARAVAHELGHYLLRSRAHDSRGLMRAAYTVDEIMDASLTVSGSAEDYGRWLAGPPTQARRETGGDESRE